MRTSILNLFTLSQRRPLLHICVTLQFTWNLFHTDLYNTFSMDRWYIHSQVSFISFLIGKGKILHNSIKTQHGSWLTLLVTAAFLGKISWRYWNCSQVIKTCLISQQNVIVNVVLHDSTTSFILNNDKSLSVDQYQPNMESNANIQNETTHFHIILTIQMSLWLCKELITYIFLQK